MPIEHARAGYACAHLDALAYAHYAPTFSHHIFRLARHTSTFLRKHMGAGLTAPWCTHGSWLGRPLALDVVVGMIARSLEVIAKGEVMTSSSRARWVMARWLRSKCSLRRERQKMVCLMGAGLSALRCTIITHI